MPFLGRIQLLHLTTRRLISKMPVFPGLGEIITSGAADADKLAAWKAAGACGVINLRTTSEPTFWAAEEETAKELGLPYYHIPIAGVNDVTRDNAEKLNQTLKSIRTEHPESPIVVHCASANRVGALLAIISAKGNTEDDIERAVSLASGFGLSDDRMIKAVWSALAPPS